MKLYGRLVKNNMPLNDKSVVNKDETIGFHDKMEQLFVDLCKELEIPVPIWLKKNTREIAQYRKTYFSNDQFLEKVYFDKFVLELEV
ncbi:MAG: hypothetical protein JXQ23_04040 [Clostridia bacterium]|nr:hypothetical protein [Clostridia bacterium]